MPEGDTVWRAARRLDDALSGQRLTRTDLRVPSLATVDLTGALVVGTLARGKHLLTRIQRGDDNLTLHTHLKMEGSWRVLRSGERWPRPAHQARVVLSTESVQAVGFSLGVVELMRTAQEDDAVGHLGPDLLGAGWDPAEAPRRLAAEPERSLHGALLDQRNLAAWETCTSPNSASCSDAAPRPRSAAQTSTGWSRWRTASWTRTADERCGRPPAARAGARRSGSTAATGARADAAAPG